MLKLKKLEGGDGDNLDQQSFALPLFFARMTIVPTATGICLASHQAPPRPEHVLVN